MKIKSVKQLRKWYVEDKSPYRTYKQDGLPLPPSVNPDFMGCNYEKESTKTIFGFFAAYHGDKSNIANFLSTGLQNAEDSQAIYEFLQNAADCESTAFYIFYNEQYFLALNNGIEFKINDVVSILNTSQSSKSDHSNQAVDCDKIGRFGIGFKLVHRLVGKNEGLIELTTEYKGPILFSWSKAEQLESLINSDDIDNIAYDDDIFSQYPWLFKILITNFPAQPDETIKDLEYQDRIVFTQEEYQELRTFLRQHQDKLDLNKLNRGSLFFLKLGEGKNLALDNKSVSLEKGVECSLNLLKSLETVVLQDKTIQKLSLLTIDFSISKDSIEFQEINPTDKRCDIKIIFGYLPYQKSQELKQYPNFYKYFPMGAEKHRLSFIIHCDAFKIETDRRELEEVSINKAIFNWFIENFCNKLEAYRNNNVNQFQKIYANLLLCNEPTKQWLIEALYAPLLSYIQKNIPTQEGNFYTEDRVKIKETNLKLTPSDFGIENQQWFYWDKSTDQELVKNAKQKLKLESWKIENLIINGNLESINKWIADLNDQSYQLLFQELNKITKWTDELIDKFCKIKLFKFTDGTYHSIPEIGDESQYLLICSDDVLDLKSILKKLDFFVSTINLAEYKTLLEKLTPQLESHLETKIFHRLSKNTSDKYYNENLAIEDKHKLFAFFKSIKGIGKETLKNLVLYKDASGQPKLLGQLLSSKLSLPIWLQPYQIDQKEYTEEIKDYFLTETHIYDQLIYPNWTTIIKNVENLLENKKIEIIKFYNDVINLFEDNNNNSSLTNYNYIFASGSFKPINEIFYSKYLSKVQSYDNLSVAIQAITQLNLPDKSIVDYLSKPPFKTDSDHLSEVISQNTVELEKDALENLIYFTELNGEIFFDIFYITLTDTSNIYSLTFKQNQDIYQYYTTKVELKSYIENNFSNYFKLIPEELYNDKLYKTGFISEHELYPKLLDQYFSDQLVENLINVVKECGRKEIEKDFLRKIPMITLKENEEYNQNCYEYQVLDLACQCIIDNDDPELKQAFRRKVKIIDANNNTCLITEGVKDEIIFYIDNIKYELILSEILPRYQGTSGLISKVFKKFKGLNKQLETLFEIGQTTIDKGKVYEELKREFPQLTNAQQLAFVVLYAKKQNNIKLLEEFSIYVN